MPITANKIFRVNVDDDRLSANLALHKDTPTQAVPVEQIIEEVSQLGIAVDQQGEKILKQFAEELAQGKTPDPVVFAKGTAPKHDENGSIEKLFEKNAEEHTEEKADNQSQSHYDQSNIIAVKKDQQLLRLLPPVTGSDGTDVYGKPIPRKLGREASIKLGPNIKQENDIITANIDGILECSPEKIWVEPKLEINGDVDFSIGNIDFDGEVVIQKNILDLFKVSSKSDITVHGLIEGAEVHTDKNLNSIGGITGKEKGILSAGNDINAKYITNAKVKAAGNVNVRIEIVNCDLVCDGSVTVENGPLVGGRTVATGGLKVKQLGSEAGVKTLVEVGIDEELKLKCQQVAPEIAQKKRKAEKVRQVVEPLLQNQKQLNSEQKEKATELLYNASELDDQADSLLDELRKVHQQAQERAVSEIEIIGCVYSGITIRFPRVEAIINMPLKGPLKILPRKVEGILRILAIDTNSGSSRILDAGATFDELWDTIDELLQSKPQSGNQKT